MKPKRLTIHEVAALTRLSPKTLRNRAYRQAGPLPVRVGGRLLWSRREVEAWVEGRDWQRAPEQVAAS